MALIINKNCWIDNHFEDEKVILILIRCLALSSIFPKTRSSLFPGDERFNLKANQDLGMGIAFAKELDHNVRYPSVTG
jgi:hypothetical protein